MRWLRPLSSMRSRGTALAVLWLGVRVAGVLAGLEPADAAASQVDFTGMSLEDLGAVVIPSVVGASRHLQLSTEAPSSVSVVTRDEVQRFGYRTMADVLRAVRGFYLSYDRTYGYTGVRGFNRPGDFGGRLLVQIDGHRVNEPLFDSTFIDTGFPLDLDLVERIEVIRGPGSSLYGNNAFFGVINVVTREARLLNGAEGSFSIGGFDTASGRFSFGKALTNGVEVLVSGSWYSSGGVDRIYVRELDTPEQNGGIADHFDRDEYQNLFASVRYRGFTLEGGFGSRQKDAPFAPYETVFNDHRQHPIDQRGFLSLGWKGETGDQWMLSGRAYYDFYRLAVDYPYEAAEEGEPSRIVLNSERDQAHWAGVEGEVSKTFRERHRLTLGGEARHDYSLEIRSFDVEPRVEVANLDRTSSRAGLFAQAEIGLATNLFVNAGGRFDYFTSLGDTVNPRAALIYNPWRNGTWKMLYGQAFRAPNIWESAFYNAFQKVTGDLKPEHIRSYELVYEQSLFRDVRLSVSGFLNETSDLIAQDLDPADSLLYYRNVDEAETLGTEFEVEYRRRNGMLFRASYSLQRTRDCMTGDEFSNSPRHLAKANLILPIWRERVFGGIEVQYSSGVLTRPESSPDRAPAFWIANLTLFSREIVPNLEISASLYNLFDRAYFTPAGDEFVPALIRQDGRSFRLKLTYRF